MHFFKETYTIILLLRINLENKKISFVYFLPFLGIIALGLMASLFNGAILIEGVLLLLLLDGLLGSALGGSFDTEVGML